MKSNQGGCQETYSKIKGDDGIAGKWRSLPACDNNLFIYLFIVGDK